MEELEIALAITPCERQFNSGNRPNVSKLFLEYCTSLLELDEDTQRLQFIHATAKDFLVNQSNLQSIDMAEAHAYIASVCLTYIGYSERSFVKRTFDTNAIPFEEPWPWFRILHPDFYSHLEQNKFLRYSAASWVVHFAQTVGVEDSTTGFQCCLEAMNAFLSSESSIIKWIEIFHFLYVIDVETARTVGDMLDQWINKYEDRRLPVKLKDAIDRTKLEFDLTGTLSTFTFSFGGFPQVNSQDDSAATAYRTCLPELQLNLLGQSWLDLIAHLGYSSVKGLCRWRRLIKTELMPRKVLHLAAYLNYFKFLEDELWKGGDPELLDAMDRTVLDQAA